MMGAMKYALFERMKSNNSAIKERRRAIVSGVLSFQNLVSSLS